jgi:nucleotide-binding universal stress UspA family protein
MTWSGGGASRPQPSMLWTRPPDPPDPGTLAPRRVLLASEGRRFPAEAVDFATRLATPAGAPVHVLSIARVWGTALGFPNPNLYPSKQEWDEQYDLVGKAVRLLESRGLKATGQVIGTRNAAGRIVGVARQTRCDAIVMAAEPPRHWLVADFLWTQEPYRVRRRARLPVYLVPVGEATLAGGAS